MAIWDNGLKDKVEDLNEDMLKCLLFDIGHIEMQVVQVLVRFLQVVLARVADI